MDDQKTKYRQRELEELEHDLLLETKKYENKLEKDKRWSKILSGALTVCTTLNDLNTDTAVGTAATGVGMIACIPLSSLAVVNSGLVLTLNVVYKRRKKKKSKWRKGLL